VSVNESGGTSGDFSITADSCTGPATAPGGTCTINVAFQPASLCPTITGTRNATLTINDNAPGNPHTVALSGTAIDFCVTIQPGQGPAQPITAGQSETFNLEVESSDPTSGSGQLTCSAASGMPGGCTVTTTPATTPPVVQITSASPGLFQLVVNSAASGSAENDGRRIRGAPPRAPAGLALWLGAILVLGVVIWTRGIVRNRERVSSVSFAPLSVSVLLFAAAIAMAACGGGGAANDPLPPAPQSNAYSVTATATITVAGATVTRTFTESVTINTP